MCSLLDKPDVPMVRCSRVDCEEGTWFHMDCADIAVLPGATEDWWCSEKCRQTGQSVLCLCKKVRRGQTVSCANAKCCSGSVFHLQCVNLQAAPGLILTLFL